MKQMAKMLMEMPVVGETNKQNLRNFGVQSEDQNYNTAIVVRLMQKALLEGESSLVLDFGEIKDDESLVTNTFPIPIPKGDYHVLRQLTYGKTGDILAKTQNIGKPGSGEHNHLKVATLLDSRGMPCSGMVGTPAAGQPDPPDPPQSSAGSGGSEGAHQHHVLVPEKMRSLKPGDRVLVAWVQNEAVVVDIIVSS